MNRRFLAICGLLALAGLFFAGLAQLLSLRFASGDAYPPGSSRRADPRGTRALHDSLAAMPGYTVQRNYERVSRLVPEPAGHTLFLLGYDAEAVRGPIPGKLADEYETFARLGGRVVLAVSFTGATDQTNAWLGVGRRLRQGSGPEANPVHRRLTDLWGFKLERDLGAASSAIHDGSVPALPAQVPWVGGQRFTDLNEAWQVIYARDGEAVVLQRILGRGSVVLLSDDFLVSNEALRHRRETRFLAWLVGANQRIVFDETHLGLSQDPGLASLVHRYHLGGALVGLAVLAGLYLWQQAIPFLPRRRSARIDSGEPATVLGRDATAGYRNLLRRAVPVAEVVPLLFARWRETAGRRLSAERLMDAQDILNLENARPRKQRDPLATYQRLAEVLNPKSH